MKYTLICLLLLITGCVTPVTRHFPDLPQSLQTRCQVLIDTPQTDKLSVVLESVIENYSRANECIIKEDTWFSWYNEQKKIFESVK